MSLALYEEALETVKRLRPEMTSVESYGWHSTLSDSAKQIAKTGFDANEVRGMPQLIFLTQFFSLTLEQGRR